MFIWLLAIWTWMISGMFAVLFHRDQIHHPLSIGSALLLVLAWPWWLAHLQSRQAEQRLQRIKIRVEEDSGTGVRDQRGR